MIEKICARLRNESHVDRSKVYSPQQCDAIEFTFRRAYDIVQEVAKEYYWIPTADRLPTWDDYAKRFWVTIRCKETGYCTTNKMRWYNLWEYENGKRVSEIFEVIAWKPYEVPAPYQKGE